MLWNKGKQPLEPSKTEIGRFSEQLAEQYLIEQGLIPVTKNYHSRQGEVDIIMLDKQTYVFIEVKYRKNNTFGGAISAIPQSKQNKIKQCITFYLHQAGLNEYNTPCRIDVVTLVGEINSPQITWLKNAF